MVKLDFSVTLVFVRSKEQIKMHHEKTRLQSFRLDQTQTRLYKQRKWLEL